MITLSILIPTYNRSACLKTCIESILIAIKNYEDRVEIIVSDDASTDDTEEIVQKIKSKNSILNFRKNLVNLYTDTHFSELIEISKNDFFWIIGDDDKISKDSLKEIFHHLDNNISLIYSNYSIWSKDFSKVIKINGLDVNNDIFINNHNDLLEKIGFNMGYISSVIGKRSHFTNVPALKRSEFLFTMPQVYPLYCGQFNNCNAVILSNCLVYNRSGNNNERKWHEIFVIGSNFLFDELLKIGYSSNSIKIAKFKVLINYVIPHTFSLKFFVPSPDFKFSLLFKYYKIYLLFYIVCLPIILIPKFIVRPFQKYVLKIPFIIKKIYGTI